MCPDLLLSILGSTALLRATAEKKFTAMSCWSTSKDVSSAELRLLMPPLFTKMSTG